jgi:hypothetical protein
MVVFMNEFGMKERGIAPGTYYPETNPLLPLAYTM